MNRKRTTNRAARLCSTRPMHVRPRYASHVHPDLDRHALLHILSHESLDLVKRYFKITRTDLEKTRQGASPVTNWLQ